jgi:glycosyltransferase involved in cell wall biosynthesis
MRLSVVIPVFNELATLEQLLDRVEAVDIEKEVIIVDDYSTDGTRDLLESMNHPDRVVVLHDRNQGKGAALRTGFARATASTSSSKTLTWSIPLRTTSH